jgi:hypothetical protein
MIHILANDTQWSILGNGTIIKFGGWDESALLKHGESLAYSKEFQTLPGTWTLSLPV